MAIKIKNVQGITQFVKHNKEWMISWSVIILAIVLIVKFWPQGPSPVPLNIRTQAMFSIIYPSGYNIEGKSWKYNGSQKSVEFVAQKDNYSVTFTEEKTPLEYQNDLAAYNRFIGSLRPRANFDVPFGAVSISNFVTAGDYQVVGETGILNTKGTLILAHPNMQITDDQWRGLFESLKVDD